MGYVNNTHSAPSFFLGWQIKDLPLEKRSISAYVSSDFIHPYLTEGFMYGFEPEDFWRVYKSTNNHGEYHK